MQTLLSEGHEHLGDRADRGMDQSIAACGYRVLSVGSRGSWLLRLVGTSRRVECDSLFVCLLDELKIPFYLTLGLLASETLSLSSNTFPQMLEPFPHRIRQSASSIPYDC